MGARPGLTIFSLTISIHLITVKIEELHQTIIAETIKVEVKEEIINKIDELNEIVEGDVLQNVEKLEKIVGKLGQITNN